VANSVPELSARAQAIYDSMDFGTYYNPARNQILFHIADNGDAPCCYDTTVSESRIADYIGIAKGELPAKVYFGTNRTFPDDCGWNWVETRPVGFTTTYEGVQVYEGAYTYNGSRIVPSWGGSMFEALMPTLVLDEPRLAAASLGANDAAHATVQRRYAVETLGYPVWGMSPSATPAGVGYGEYGVRTLGSLGYPAGAVTPHAAALALAVTPREAVANLRQLATRYDLYGDYGLYDAVDPTSGQVTRTYLALDQAMILIAAANYLKDGVVQRRFAADPIVANVLPLLSAENFFE